MSKFTVRKVSNINAPKENVWTVLLTPEPFSKWSRAFCPDSEMEGAMEGEWKDGGTITYSDNKGMGIKGKVVEFKPYNLAKIEYIAVLENFSESFDKDGWIGCKETYTLSDKNGMTTLTIETEVPTKELYEEFNKSWGTAISSIKELSEIQSK